MKTQPIIQGDVCLIPLMDLPEGFSQTSTEKVVVAHGESGNVHVIEEHALWLKDCIEDINEYDNHFASRENRIVVTEPTELRHLPETEEAKSDTHHAPLVLEPGIYALRIQEEFDYATQQNLPVFD